LASFFTYSQRLGKYFLPPLLFFIGILLFYQQQAVLLSQWFGKLYCLSNASLTLAALIALYTAQKNGRNFVKSAKGS